MKTMGTGILNKEIIRYNLLILALYYLEKMVIDSKCSYSKRHIQSNFVAIKRKYKKNILGKP